MLSVAEEKEVIGKGPAGALVRGEATEGFTCQAEGFGLCPKVSRGGAEELRRARFWLLRSAV